MISIYEKSLLRDLNVDPRYFGIIFSILTIVSSFSARYQDKIHNRYRNKALTFMSMVAFISFILVGAVAITNVNSILVIVIIIFGFSIQHFIRAPYWTLYRKYLTNFTNSNIRAKILSAYELVKGIGGAVTTFLAGVLLEYYSTAKSYLIVGILGLIIVLLILNYMRERVGLNPEEYDKEDIEYGNS